MKTLITHSFKLTEPQKSQLASLGLEITYQHDTAPVEQPEQFELVICYDLFSNNDLSQFSSLKYIQLTSVGVDHLPLAEIERRGILLRNARGVSSVPIAEFVLGGVLQIYKKANQFWQNQQQHQWKRLHGLQEIAGKRVCIVGAGSIGCELAKRFAAFDAQVLGVNPSPVSSPWFAEVWPLERLAEALGLADIVALSLPLLPETTHLFNAERLAQMKQGALLVNVARGPIVDEQALLAALQSGHLQGAVLDVFEQEPLPEDSPLWDLPNVVLTPHNAFLSESKDARLFEIVQQNLRDWFKLAGC